MAREKRIGIIAEDISDFTSLTKLIPKIKSGKYVFRKALGKGCGRLRSKSHRFGTVLLDQGCTELIVIRDSDGEDANKLKQEIRTALHPNPFEKHVIVIAVQELESWLLADIKAVHQVFSRTKRAPREIPSPEVIDNPKEYLSAFVKANYGKKYLNSIHNSKIADGMSINKITRKCPSFMDLVNFVNA
ncbi:MAG: DUF4276 family protein [Candidatus Thiodiazotropha sp.]